MLTLYYKPTCPFSKKVISAASQLGIDLNLKSIVDNEDVANELKEKGGKRQVPYLYNEATGQGLYESSDIIEYLETDYQPVK